MRKVVVAMLLAWSAVVVAPASATIVFSGFQLPTQAFDSLGTSTVNGAFSATVGAQSSFPGATGFDGTKIAGTGTNASNFIADNGTLNTGALYSYGATSAADRALGAIASGTNAMAFGFSLLNNSSLIITSIQVSLTQENWRTSTSSTNTLTAAWGTSATLGVTPTNFLSAGGLATASSLNLVGPAPVAANGAIDGNDPSNQVAKSFTFTGLWLSPSDRFYLRWSDFNDVGNDAGIAIDNMTLTITAIPEPGAVLFGGVVCGLVGAAAASQRLRTRLYRSTKGGGAV